MLKLAVQAQLPIIAVTTRDTLNLPTVVREITGRKPVKFVPQTKLEPDTVYLQTGGDGSKLPLFEFYEKLVKLESSLILVNPSQVCEPMFDAGEVPTPKKLLLQFVNKVTSDLKTATVLTRGLGGCTLKEAAEFARLTMARDNSLTVQGLTETRRSSFQGSSGLAQVDLRQDFYDPPEKLAEFTAKEKSFFLEGTDHRLTPRGLLFDGPPGTGKTAGARYLAEQWGIPLYRVDIGGTKNKYVGQSEANMLTNLTRLDHEEPCVALLDEVEKVFQSGSHDGTTSTMLSQLLWWLAERRTKVFVVMTTNNAKALPKELYREGRIDESMWFGGLDSSEAVPFVKSVLNTFEQAKGVSALQIADIVKKTPEIAGSQPVKYSQAALTKATYAFVKALKKPVSKEKAGAQD